MWIATPIFALNAQKAGINGQLQNALANIYQGISAWSKRHSCRLHQKFLLGKHVKGPSQKKLLNPKMLHQTSNWMYLLSTKTNDSIKDALFKSFQHLHNYYYFLLVFYIFWLFHHFGAHRDIFWYRSGPVHHWIYINTMYT